MSPTLVRLLLLQDLSGRLTPVVRREIVEWLAAKPEVATSVVAQHVQITKLPQPRVATRERPAAVEVQVSLQVKGELKAGAWCSGPTLGAAEHQAHLSLLVKLCGLDAAPSSLAADVRKSSERVGIAHLWSRDRAVTGSRLGGSTGALEYLLANNWDLLYDVDTCPSSAQLLLLPPDRDAMDRDVATIGLQARRSRLRRTIVRPDGTAEDAHCLRVDLFEGVPLLGSASSQSEWTESTRLLASIIRAALNWVSADRIMPTVGDAHVYADRHASWRIAPLSRVIDEQLARWGQALDKLPKCCRTYSGTTESTSSAETARQLIDAVAEHLGPNMEHWAMKNQIALPQVASAGINDPLQDWVDDLEAGAEGLSNCGLIVRIEAPRLGSDQPSVRAELLFESQSGIAVPADDVWRGLVKAPVSDSRLRLRTRCLLRHAGRLFSPLRALGDQHRPASLLIGLDNVAKLRGRVGSQLAQMGITFDWDADWLATLEPRVLIGEHSPVAEPDGTLGLPQVLDRRWQLTLDGEPLTDDEMALLAQEVMPVVRLRNRWVLMDDSIRQKAGQPQLDPVEPPAGALQALLGTVRIGDRTYACSPTDGLAHLLYRLRQTEGDSKASPSARATHLHGLRRHQQAAVSWLERIGRFGLNGLLADDMGVGKTLTALAFHRSPLRPFGDLATLVVCPNGDLVQKWGAEAAALMPDLAIHLYWGSHRYIPSSFSGVVVTTYSTLARDQENLSGHQWGMVVVDEAQRIKNPKTQTARAVRRMSSPRRLALSGTPLENHPRELHAILDWLNPGLFGTRQQFESRFVTPLRQTTGAEDERVQRERAHQMVGLVLLRRTKADPKILPGLPARQDFIHRIELSTSQRSLLQALGLDTATQFSFATSTRRSGEVLLRLIEAARQVCNSPAHYRGDAPSSVLTDPRKAAEEAPKLARMGEILTEVTGRAESALVFTPYVVMADLIHAYLGGLGLESLRYHGMMTRSSKRQALEKIRTELGKILVVTVGSGGVGLDLVRPNHVLHYDRTWSPAQEDQASDRVHRLGQRREVQVHHLIHANSIEEHIAAKHVGKRRYADHFLPADGATPTRLDPRDLASLFQLDRR
ncbi:DEAD/DEAH box helicase [Kribbella deserti]